jgi:hypothetical protein
MALAHGDQRLMQPVDWPRNVSMTLRQLTSRFRLG